MRRLTILAVQAAIAVLLLETGLRLNHPLPFRLRGEELILPIGLTYRFDNHGDPKLDPVTTHTRNSMRRLAADQVVFLIDLAHLLPKDSRYFSDLFHSAATALPRSAKSSLRSSRRIW